ncbi:MAG: glycosyl hydrolase 115 family protein [Luteolibacter sp.]
MNALCYISRFFLIAVLLVLPRLQADPNLGLSENLVVSENPPAGSFPLVSNGVAAPLWLAANDWPGVRRAAGDLQTDVQRVTSLTPALSTAGGAPSAKPVIIGTVGKSALIDSLIASGKLDAADLTGRWESFVITTVAQPFPGVDQALVIAGSDKRGTIYGIYELSAQLGVSPWYWWADVPAKTRTSAHVVPGRFTSGEPVVKYRGIFLNDEAPALTGWSDAKFGDRNSQFYAKVFELLLRLRGNYLWPAMWGDAFNEDDPLSPALADEYGIVMGTSHHEPMLRAQQEWSRHKTNYGNATWDYQTNEAGLKQFWTDGIARNKNYESIVTVGMRGDGDAPMIEGGSMADNVTLLSRIITDQRSILTTQTAKPAEQTPQIWALYKEVLDYYDYGMRVPDDVTLLWPDDNWGNIRRLPATAEERNRSGGSGVYYHFDYVGGPRNYKWLNTNPLPKIQEQMNLAWQHGADRVWIVNVGDLKPMEVPIEFFLRMAWNPARWPAESTGSFLKQWAEREFGAAYAEETASIVATCTKYNGWRKPELLAKDTFSLQNYREAERIRQLWRDLSTRAHALYNTLPANTKDTFYQLVLHPVKASATGNDLYITAAFNNLYSTQQRASTNTVATQAQALFQADADLVTYWNTTFAGGRWIHMMDQVHIGYTTWSDPAANVIPALSSYTAPATADLGVVLEGSTSPLAAGANGSLPALYSEGGAASRFIEFFRKGTQNVSYSITANQPWVNITNPSGTLGSDTRSEVGIDFSRAPTGSGEVILAIQGPGGTAARSVRLPFTKAAVATADRPLGFLDPEGYLAIEAPHYDRAVEAGGVTWKTSPDLGRTLGGVMPMPVTATSITSPGGSSARLEYDIYLRRKGETAVRLVVSPTLNFFAGRMQRCAVSLDGQTPQIVSVGADVSSSGWDTSVKDSVRVATALVSADSAGPHVLKVWMVDPGVVLQRIEVDTGGLKTSYLGPPESPRGRRVAASGSGTTSGSSVTIEAESGTLGAEYPAYTSSVPGYISPTTNNTGSSPGSSARVASYQITFPLPGNYRLFARIRVGPGGANDDSLFLGNGFGTKSPTTAGNWKTINGLSGVGFTVASDVVAPSSGSGTAGSGVWKWVDLTTLSTTPFTVSSGALTQTLQIGPREDGLDIDKLIFGLTANTFTVDDLNLGNSGSAPAPGMVTLEAEASTYGAEFTSTTGSPAYLSISTTNTGTSPGSAARVMRFQAVFPAAGSYRLLARIRVGAGGFNDDSLYAATGFGAKDPTLASDWRSINGLAGLGFSTSTDVVTPSPNGTAGSGVWKWVDLTSTGGAGPFTVATGSLTQTYDVGAREDGLDIDKIAFVPDGNTYTVANLDSGSAGTALISIPVITAVVSEEKQTIDGFGASSAWNGTTFSDTLSDTLFSPTSGIGLSLIRLRIAPDGTTVETGTAKKAIARGAKAWATPWSPPAVWKSNNDVSNGGTLLPERYADWAASLANFALAMKNTGVPLAALSAQNEPNYTATWESCTWTPATMTTFIRDNLGPALAARGVATRVLAPETISSNAFPSFADAILGDPVARSYVSHLGLHCYGADPVAYPAAAANGMSYWETEFTDDGADSDPGMASALRVADAIHDFLAVDQGNAWHYWWLTQGATASTGSLTENNVLAKRGWAMGNWSRFVRPGARRVETSGSTSTIRASAFIAPGSRRFVLVVVNNGTSAASIPVAINSAGVTSLTPWETSDTGSLTALTPVTTTADGSFTIQIPGRSVTSFVSDSLNRPPSGLTLGTAAIRENLPAGTVAGSLLATDSDPGETFGYSLVSGTGDTDNASFSITGNELRTASPLDFETGPTRSVRVRVTDSLGASHEQILTVNVVNDLAEYADWAASLPASQRGAGADPDGDGFVNLLGYAFGSVANEGVPPANRPALGAVSGGTVSFTFVLPAVAPSDVRYQIERSIDLGEWRVLASKDGSGPWSGSVSLTSEASPAGGTRFTMVAPISASSAYFRLRCILPNSQPTP